MKITNLLASITFMLPLTLNAQEVETKLESRGFGEIPVYFEVGSFSGVPLTGVGVGYKLSDKLEFDLAYQSGNIDLKGDVEVESHITVTDTSLKTAQVKVLNRYYPWAGVFNLSSGLGYRSIQSKIGVADRRDGSAVDGSTSSKAFTANIGISSLWKFDNGIRVGADWLEASIPLASASSNSFSTTGRVDTSEEDAKKTLVKLSESFAKSPMVEMKAHVGFEF